MIQHGSSRNSQAADMISWKAADLHELALADSLLHALFGLACDAVLLRLRHRPIWHMDGALGTRVLDNSPAQQLAFILRLLI